MRSALIKYLFVALWLTLVSWGPRGHRITALIAEKNLTLQTRKVINDLLDGQSMADVSNWADSAKSHKRQYYNPKSHRLNIPVDLITSYEFETTLAKQKALNVYTSIIYQISILRANQFSKSQKSTALKLLIHLMGDIHQPMNVFKQTQPINGIYNGQKSPLYDLWDNIILNQQKQTDTEIADSLNRNWPVPPARIIYPQHNTDLRYWLRESYALNAYLMPDTAETVSINAKNYEKEKRLILSQLFTGGMRLANLLNLLYDDRSDGTKLIQTRDYIDPDSIKTDTANLIHASYSIDTSKLKNRTVKLLVSGVYGFNIYDDKVLLNLGNEFPYQKLTIVLVGDAMKYFKKNFYPFFYATGKVIMYDGKAEMIIAEQRYFEPRYNVE